MASCALVGAAGAQTASDDPEKLNVERSVYSPGPRPPADLVVVYEFAPVEDGFIRFTLVTTNQQGAPVFQLAVFKADGQQRPVHNANTLGAYMATGQQTNLTRSYRRIDARTMEFTTFNNGVAGNPQVRTVSPNGQTYVNVVRGTAAPSQLPGELANAMVGGSGRRMGEQGPEAAGRIPGRDRDQSP